MGTRSLTKVFQDDKEMLCIYRQYDGYPSGHGRELAKFLNSGELVNGIPGGNEKKVFNGIGCLAAQLVMELKKEHGPAGGIYIQLPGTEDAGQDYEYHIYGEWPKGGGMSPQKIAKIKVFGYGTKKALFSGSLERFTAWVAKQ